MIFKKIGKNWQEIGVFSQTTAIFCKNWITTLVLEKRPIFAQI
jgi:hypothetical protein